jgi:methylmalonyl-CoA mutase N-terminal domain/subunit
MYIANAENEGYQRKKLGGTIQNDCLKEFIAQKTSLGSPYILSPTDNGIAQRKQDR